MRGIKKLNGEDQFRCPTNAFESPRKAVGTCPGSEETGIDVIEMLVCLFVQISWMR
jgi:hypothetical protein